MLFILTIKSLYLHGSIIPGLECAICKDKSSCYLCKYWLEFYKITWQQMTCSKEFCNNIQQYNVAFSITSVGVKIDNSVIRQSGLYCFKIQELHHLRDALFFYSDQTPIYAQIYILDTVEQLNVKRANNRNLDSVVMVNLQTIYHKWSLTIFVIDKLIILKQGSLSNKRYC